MINVIVSFQYFYEISFTEYLPVYLPIMNERRESNNQEKEFLHFIQAFWDINIYVDGKIPFIFEFGARVLLIGFFDKFERENLTIKEPSICENKITDFSEERKNAG